MKCTLQIIVAATLLLTLNHLSSTASAQGSLTPPGPPGPTMLTLSQVEARTPVDAVHTPGNSSAEFVITNPGSYYMTANIFGIVGKDGIDIDTNDVTLDLNGFSLFGLGSAYGIQIPNGCANVTVSSGAFSGWSQIAIRSFAGNATFDRLNVCSNFYGLFAYGSSVIRDCVASANLGTGIGALGNNCFVFNNLCVSNEWGIAILGNNIRIEDNHVVANATQYGIFVNSPSTNNIIIRNSVIGAGANDYVYPSVQISGPLITNVVSGVITNSNPWANFAF